MLKEKQNTRNSNWPSAKLDEVSKTGGLRLEERKLLTCRSVRNVSSTTPTVSNSTGSPVKQGIDESLDHMTNFRNIPIRSKLNGKTVSRTKELLQKSPLAENDLRSVDNTLRLSNGKGASTSTVQHLLSFQGKPPLQNNPQGGVELSVEKARRGRVQSARGGFEGSLTLKVAAGGQRANTKLPHHPPDQPTWPSPQVTPLNLAASESGKSPSLGDSGSCPAPSASSSSRQLAQDLRSVSLQSNPLPPSSSSTSPSASAPHRSVPPSTGQQQQQQQQQQQGGGGGGVNSPSSSSPSGPQPASARRTGGGAGPTQQTNGGGGSTTSIGGSAGGGSSSSSEGAGGGGRGLASTAATGPAGGGVQNGLKARIAAAVASSNAGSGGRPPASASRRPSSMFAKAASANPKGVGGPKITAKNMQYTPRSVLSELPLEPAVWPEREQSKRTLRWQAGRHTFRADFDSANLAGVQQVLTPGCTTLDFELWTSPDNHGTEFETGHSTWFYFGVTGISKGDVLYMTMMNLNRQGKLFGNDMRPVTRQLPNLSKWERCQNQVSYQTTDDGKMQMKFKHEIKTCTSKDDEVFFAFCYPWSLEDNEELLRRVEGRLSADAKLSKQIYWHRQTLAFSLEHRPMQVITLTQPLTQKEKDAGEKEEPEEKWEEKEEEAEGLNLFPVPSEGRPTAFPNKKVLVISSRVHPGETPAAHMFNGALAFLLRSDDPRAQALRQIFVFKLIPNLNPDGVFRGHYRTDTRGTNLNRCYESPTAQQPTIQAARALVTHYAALGQLGMYIDLHAHANKRGCFLFGNNLDSAQQQVENVLFAKLAALNSPHFDFNACDFSERGMHAKDRGGEATKDGSGRVALYRATDATHIYTCEANYNTSRILNVVQHVSVQGKEPQEKDLARIGRTVSPPSRSREPTKYDLEAFAGMGRCLLVAALDLKEANPWSRIPNTEFKTVTGVRLWVGACQRSNVTKRDIKIAARFRDSDDDG